MMVRSGCSNCHGPLFTHNGHLRLDMESEVVGACLFEWSPSLLLQARGTLAQGKGLTSSTSLEKEPAGQTATKTPCQQ